MSVEGYFRCDVEWIMCLRQAGLWDEDRGPLWDWWKPSDTIRQTLYNATLFKLREMSMASVKGLLPGIGSDVLQSLGITTQEEADAAFKKRKEDIINAVAEHPLVKAAIKEACDTLFFRTMRAEDPLANVDFISARLSEKDVSFFLRLANVVKSGPHPWIEKLDAVILLNWSYNSNWHAVAGHPGELTLPDELMPPLCMWSDNAALEYVRYFSGLGHSLSSAAYIQRRKRWGLHPERPTVVKSAQIRMVENKRTSKDFLPDKRRRDFVLTSLLS